MKTFLFFLFASLANAGTVTLAWDANAPEDQVTTYTLYEQVGQNKVEVGHVDGTLNQITLANVVPGQHTYFLTAKNATTESGPSNSVTTVVGITAPKNLHIK